MKLIVLSAALVVNPEKWHCFEFYRLAVEICETEGRC